MKKFVVSFVALFMGLSMAFANGQQEEKTSANVATDWPTKSIQIVVPFNAGGDTDFHARTYAKYLKDILGQPVSILNVAGANGSAGTIQVRDANPDGYTALFFHDSMLMNKVVGVTDFAQEALDPCCIGVFDHTYILAVNSKSPYKTLGDLIAAAKANPGQLKYASSIGGYTYYLGCLLEKAAGVSFNKVDAGGGSARNAALLAEKIDTNVNPYGVMKPYIDSGDFRALAVFSEKRSQLFPDVPTAKEQGYDVIGSRAYFLAFPKGTDPIIIKKMADAMKQVSENPNYASDIEKAYCVEPGYAGTQATIKYLNDTLAAFEADKNLILGK
ncbi:MAG: tripartite tricarboxylate transporter substrate binding protein [Spirochaetia bacterium]|jgi:tripartite-type tricarboxylate transporter receptor subunit TctC|nr:tripartite tricarboxylate transporter substrate binding protein [Spirochaetia bacterium]